MRSPVSVRALGATCSVKAFSPAAIRTAAVTGASIEPGTYNYTPGFTKLDVLGALSPGLIDVVFVFLLLALFDSIGTLIGVASRMGLVRDGKLALDDRALSKLHWRSRRGLLENDLFIQRFFEQYESQLTVANARGLYALMDLSDNDLLDLLLKRKELPDTETQEEALEVLSMLRH